MICGQAVPPRYSISAPFSAVATRISRTSFGNWAMTSRRGGIRHLPVLGLFLIIRWCNSHVNHSDLTNPTWQSQLNTPATLQVALLTNLFTKYLWWLLVPDQTHQIVTAGFGTYSAGNENLYSANYATTAWITNGSLSL